MLLSIMRVDTLFSPKALCLILTTYNEFCQSNCRPRDVCLSLLVDTNIYFVGLQVSPDRG